MVLLAKTKSNIVLFICIVLTAMHHYVQANTSLVLPKNNSYQYKDTIFFQWNKATVAISTTYEINVAVDTNFNNIIISDNSLIGIDTNVVGLPKNNKYFWNS